jgi:hypothetical protein
MLAALLTQSCQTKELLMKRPSNNPVDTLSQLPDDELRRLPEAQILFPHARSFIFAWETGSLVFSLYAETTDPEISWIRIRSIHWKPPFYHSIAFLTFQGHMFEDRPGKGIRY